VTRLAGRPSVDCVLTLSPRRRSPSRIACAGVLAVLLAYCSACSRDGDGDAGGSTSDRSPERKNLTGVELFIEVTSYWKAGDNVALARCRAAKQLVTTEGAESWAVLALLKPYCADVPEATRMLATSPYIILDPVERSVIAAMLKNIPTDANPALLWAATYHLLDQECGELGWVERRKDGHDVFSDATTRPVRELAREALKRSLGMDLGYDANAWREAIGRYKTSDSP